MRKIDINDEAIQEGIHQLISLCGGSPESFDGELITQMIESSLKLISDKHDTGQLKMINRSLKEMRYAYRIFNEYKGLRRISIFGSARTPEDHPDYLAAKAFGAEMAREKWMCITGAANGIMKAGLEGSTRSSSFGLSIRLPFEVPNNCVLEGDPKLIVFRYFFIRKLMFISHSDALAAFPGGVGTMDELFEVLTLIQTGKSNIVPIVLVEGAEGSYWKSWEKYMQDQLLANGWICAADQNLYYIAPSVEAAVEHVLKFYKRYHSLRYVKDCLVLRLLEPLTEEQMAILNDQFSLLLKEGCMQMSPPLPEESDHLELPRLIFHHTRRDYGLVRALIDRINDF